MRPPHVVATALVIALTGLTAPAAQTQPTPATSRPSGSEPDAASGSAAADVPSAPAGRLPPRPAEVTATGGPATGELVVSPPALALTVRRGRAYQPSFVVANGTRQGVDLRLSVTPVRAGPDGRPRLPRSGASSRTGDDGADGTDDSDRPPSPPAATGAARLAEEHLRLAPTEQARIYPTITIGDRTPVPSAAALRVSTPSTTVRSMVLLRPPDARAPATRAALDPAVSRTTLRVTLDTAAGAVVRGDIQLHSWFGTTTTTAVPTTIALPGVTRTTDIVFATPTIPGPYTATVRLTTSDGAPVTATARAWIPPGRNTLIALATLLVTATLTAIWLLRRKSERAPDRGPSEGPSRRPF